MCLDYGLSMEQPAPARGDVGVVPLALGLCPDTKRTYA